MTEAERAILQAIVLDSERLAARARALLSSTDVPAADELVPLAKAAQYLRITKAAARKRAVRGAGVKIGSRWFFDRSTLEGGESRSFQ